jgi:hypothetical protein
LVWYAVCGAEAVLGMIRKAEIMDAFQRKKALSQASTLQVHEGNSNIGVHSQYKKAYATPLELR